MTPIAPPRHSTLLLRATAVAGLVALSVLPAQPAAADSIRADQWQLTMLEARKAWEHSTGSGVTVAVIDSGVDGRQPDLQGRVLPGIDYVQEGGDGTADEAGHGTTVAGLIAGNRDDTDGVVGLAPDAKILPVRVLDSTNAYKMSLVVAEAVVWAVDHGAKVINLSLGSEKTDTVLADAIDYAFAHDVVVVACAGNVTPGGSQDIWHPAREPGVIAVGAVSPDGKAWRGSLIGREMVLTAPGSSLMGAKPGGYETVQGTSFAAPLVSATAALVRSRYPQMSAANVVQRLIRTARDEGLNGRDSRYGFGIIDPVAALTRDVPAVDTNPLDTAPPPGTAAFGPAQLDESVPLRTGTPDDRAASDGDGGAPESLQPNTSYEARAAQAPMTSGGIPWLSLATALGAVVLLAASAAVFMRRL